MAASSLAIAVLTAAQTPQLTSVRVEIAGLRDARGMVRLCLTHDQRKFPDCDVPGAIHATVRASKGPIYHEFRGVSPGVYAVAAFHDANGNGKLDTMFGIPREGFAFSRNPKIHARPPRFNEASFMSNGSPLTPLIMKYLL